MRKIRELFNQLHLFLNEEMDIKTCQEFHLLAKQLVNHVDGWHEWIQRDMRDGIDFFQDATVSQPLSFGQCGNTAYWKVVDGVLHIGGSGPMWNFDNSSTEYRQNDVFSPWQETDYNTVIIHNGVTTIGADAFHGAKISSIMIPNSIRTIETLAFFDAKIEKLILPETIETLEEYILCGFSRVVDTLVVSVNIPNIKPFAFFNRDDIVANTVILTGALPDDLTPLVESCLFDDVARCKIRYPEAWDTAEVSFYEKLLQKFPDSNDVFLKDLKKSLTPHKF